jgi:hypothetical protein
MRRRRRTARRPGRGGRSGARRGTAGEPEGGDGGQRKRGSVTRAPKLSRPTMPWPLAARASPPSADGVRACLVPGVIVISPGWRAAGGAGRWLPATTARVAPCPAFQLRGGGLGREALGGLALPGAGLCAGQSTRSVRSPSTSSMRLNSPTAWPAWGTVCAMSQARTTREGVGPLMAAWWSASTGRSS